MADNENMADNETSPLGMRRGAELRRRRLHHAQRKYVLVLAAGVGFAAGGIAVVYQIAVDWAQDVSRSLASHTSSLGFVSWPVLIVIGAAIGAAAGWITGRFAPEAGGSGIPHVKAVLMSMRSIRPDRLIPVKIIGGLTALLSGMSLGREGPTIQIGAAIGKFFAKLFHAPRRSHTPLIAAGAGAGLAAAFNAPLAGFIFVMEELKREMSPLTYGAALISSVCAVAVTRVELGQRSSFTLNNPSPVPLRALPIVGVIGVVVGGLGVVFNKLTMGSVRFRTTRKLPRSMCAAVIGAVAALCLRLLPEATGVGHRLAEQLLSGSLAPGLGFLALFFVGKLLLTSTSFGTGVPGGIFAPVLAMGCLAGLFLGEIATTLFPTLGVSPQVMGTIGMAAFLSSSVRAPLTGVVLVVEMTGEYSLLYALLLGAFASYIVAEVLHDDPIYEALLHLDLHGRGEFGQLPESAVPIDVMVEPDSYMDGRLVKNLELPEGALIVTIERNAQLIVPSGSTRLQEGDHLTVVLGGLHGEQATLTIHDAARAP